MMIEKSHLTSPGPLLEPSQRILKRILIVPLPFKLLFKLVFDMHCPCSIQHIFTCVHRNIHLIHMRGKWCKNVY